MKQFASKEIINVAAVVTGFTIVCCILLYTFVKADMTEDSVLYQEALADTLLKSMKHDMLMSDRKSLQHTISNIGQQERVKYVRIFNHSGLIGFSSDPVEVYSHVDRESDACKKCHRGSKPYTTLVPMERASIHVNDSGESVMSLMTPIYNEASCSTGDCHYHAPEQLLLGGLDFGLSQKQLETSLARLRLRMIIFCIMILILTMAGVTALLWRGVMQPLRDLVDFASRCYEGKHEGQPPLGTSEINYIGHILKKMSVERDKSQLSADPEEGESSSDQENK